MAGRGRVLASSILVVAVLLGMTVSAQASVLPVINTNDTGNGSLRAAIDAANADTDLDVVDATGVSGTINLGTALEPLTQDAEIRGPGPGQLTVRRGMAVMNSFRIFTVNPGVTAEISGLTIASGNVSGTSTGGAGINNAGTLTLRDDVVTGNVNTVGGVDSDGGGILNSGTLTVLRTTVSGNSAETGGGISNRDNGVLTVRASTVSGNTATEASAGGRGAPGSAITSAAWRRSSTAP